MTSILLPDTPIDQREFLTKQTDLPKVLICGPGGCGKDHVCRWFGAHTRLVDAGSTSGHCAEYIAESLGIPPKLAWQERRNNRMYWREWCDEYRRDDEARIVRERLECGDICNGCRALVEIQAVKATNGLVDYIVWINNPRIGPDATLEFGSEECDIILHNDADIPTLESRCVALATRLGLEVFAGRQPYV